MEEVTLTEEVTETELALVVDALVVAVVYDRRLEAHETTVSGLSL